MPAKDQDCDLGVPRSQIDAMPRSGSPYQEVNRIFRSAGGGREFRPVPFGKSADDRRNPAAGPKFLGRKKSRRCCVPAQAEVQCNVRGNPGYKGNLVYQRRLFVVLAKVTAAVERIRCYIGQPVGCGRGSAQMQFKVRVQPVSSGKIRGFYLGEHGRVARPAEKDFGSARATIDQEDEVVRRAHRLQKRSERDGEAWLPKLANSSGDPWLGYVFGTLQTDTTPVVYTTQ